MEQTTNALPRKMHNKCRKSRTDYSHKIILKYICTGCGFRRRYSLQAEVSPHGTCVSGPPLQQGYLEEKRKQFPKESEKPILKL